MRDMCSAGKETRLPTQCQTNVMGQVPAMCQCIAQRTGAMPTTPGSAGTTVKLGVKVVRGSFAAFVFHRYNDSSPTKEEHKNKIVCEE